MNGKSDLIPGDVSLPDRLGLGDGGTGNVLPAGPRPVAMTGGEALARQLQLEGIEHIFGVPGTQLDWAVDGLAKLEGGVELRTTRHEQGAAYMADGYARASGGIGAFMVVPGPGLLNAAAALATGFACSSRMLGIVGQLPSRTIGRGWGMLHEIPEQSRLIGSLTKWSATARRPEDIPYLVRTAVTEAQSGRPRPVAVEVPPDILATTAEVALLPPTSSVKPVIPDDHQIDAVVRLLTEARKPVIIAGGGVVAAGASGALGRLASLLGAPVALTRNGRGALSDRHPLALGPLGVPYLLAEADVVLVVGSRFMTLKGQPVSVPGSAKVVLINADPADVSAPRVASVRMVSDACVALEAIADCIGGPASSRRSEASRYVGAIRRHIDEQLAFLEPQMGYLKALRAAIPDDGIFVNELTQVGYVASLGYPVYEPRTFLTPGYQGTLGYGFPTGLGAKVASPDKAVVTITGDGGFGWCLAELATARKYGIGSVTVVFNDGAFGNVRRTQRVDFGGRVYGTDLTNPDFVALARAFGVAATTVSEPTALRDTVSECIATDEPAVIVVPMDECPSPWGLISATQELSDMERSWQDNLLRQTLSGEGPHDIENA